LVWLFISGGASVGGGGESVEGGRDADVRVTIGDGEKVGVSVDMGVTRADGVAVPMTGVKTPSLVAGLTIEGEQAARNRTMIRTTM